MGIHKLSIKFIQGLLFRFVQYIELAGFPMCWAYMTFDLHWKQNNLQLSFHYSWLWTKYHIKFIQVMKSRNKTTPLYTVNFLRICGHYIYILGRFGSDKLNAKGILRHAANVKPFPALKSPQASSIWTDHSNTSKCPTTT